VTSFTRLLAIHHRFDLRAIMPDHHVGDMHEEEHRAYFLKIGMADGFEQRVKEMKRDKAKFDGESDEDMDCMLDQERAYLPLEDQKTIIKLDETNNDSYKYLRDRGNMWQYDPKKVHHMIRKRLYRRFDTFDRNSNGSLTIHEILHWGDRMKPLCNATDEDVNTVREALNVFFTNKGCQGDGVCRENWVESNRVLAEADRERVRRGEKRLVDMLGDAYFDILDTNRDGKVTLPELKTMMNIFHVPDVAAYTFFVCADTDKSGILDRQEMHDMFVRFWMSDEYDPSIDGIYAYKY